MRLSELSAMKFTGRNRRLLTEWERIDSTLAKMEDIEYSVTGFNDKGIAIEYEIIYLIRSFCGVEDDMSPKYADRFVMRLSIPDEYPCADAPVELTFALRDGAMEEIAHPWHPNIKYFGAFAGRVCLNNMDSYTELAWCVERVAHYLRYERYHAENHPPFPEDLTVARWVVDYGEANGYIEELLKI